MKLQSTVLVLLLPALASSDVCFEEGDCKEVALDFTATATPEECLAYCQSRDNCNWFTWYGDTICITFADCQLPLSPDCNGDDFCISGEKNCSTGAASQCDLPGQCASVPLSSAVTGDIAECQAFCLDNQPNCQWFTYNNASLVCLLFEDCGNLTACQSCVSAQVNCSFFQCGLVGQCQAVVIATDAVESEDECLQDCKDLEPCEWYTFNDGGGDVGACLLFAECDELNDCQTCSSGEDDCEISTS